MHSPDGDIQVQVGMKGSFSEEKNYSHICQWLMPISSYSLFNLHVSTQPKWNSSHGKDSVCEKYLTKKLMNLINKNAYIHYSLYLPKHILLTAGDTS